MPTEEFIAWRTKLEYEYALICKFCHRKVIDPDKTSQQVFTKSKCPHCFKCKEQSKTKVRQKFRVAC